MVDTPSYDPADVSALFDRCAGNYRRWSAASSFGFVGRWRKEAVAQLDIQSPAVIVDLMAGTGEVWPYVLSRFPTAEFTHLDADALRAQGLKVELRRHFFGCATSVCGRKPVA